MIVQIKLWVNVSFMLYTTLVVLRQLKAKKKEIKKSKTFKD